MFKLNRKLSLAGLAVLLTSFTAASAFAGTSPQTTTFNVTATIAKSCSVTAATLAFGTYDPLVAPDTTATNTVSVTCTTGTTFTVALNKGTTVGGAFTLRLMTDSPGTIGYNIYIGATTSPGCTGSTVWGDGSGATVTVAGTGAGSATPQVITGHGCMVSGENGNGPGSYSDVVTATVTF